MKQITTKDGSVTFHNEEYDETYHSVSGAMEESVEKFVKPALFRVGERVRILDVCFGLGYNSAAALDLLGSDCGIEIVGLENDPKIIGEIINVKTEFKNYSLIRKATEEMVYNDGRVKLELVLGDARETIKGLDDGFDIVFLDPFSPKKCPELWSYEFLSDITSLMKKGGILTTYSCARLVRDNLRKLGLQVKDGPSVGRKAPSTIAVK